MYAYCANNPINRTDLTGRFWKEVGDFFKSIGNALASLFGASSQVVVEEEKTVSSTPVYSPISAKTGVKSTTIISSKGNSSKPISVYANGVSNNPVSFTAGVKINIAKCSFDFSLGLDNVGLKFSIANGDINTSSALKLDITELKLGFEAEMESRITENIYESAYGNTSINGGIVGAIYMFVNAGTWNSSSQYAY